MANRILDVISISTATGWYFDNPLAVEISDFRPVMCFALALVFDPDYPNLEKDKLIVPISADEYGMSIIGSLLIETTVITELEAKSRLSR